MSRKENQNCAARVLRHVYTNIGGDGWQNGNKNNLTTTETQIVQKLKNNEPRPKFTGSYKKKAYKTANAFVLCSQNQSKLQKLDRFAFGAPVFASRSKVKWKQLNYGARGRLSQKLPSKHLVLCVSIFCYCGNWVEMRFIVLAQLVVALKPHTIDKSYKEEKIGWGHEDKNL